MTYHWQIIFFKCIRYADDTTLYCNVSKTLLLRLLKINQWLGANKLSLNVLKQNGFYNIVFMEGRTA